MTVVLDRTTTILASLKDVQRSLMISVLLVILVVFVFLRSARATLIPSVAVPVSLIGTFSVMYLLGYSLDNLSLMALTISTGFVVDDAIVVMENISRYVEQGMAPFDAAMKGAQEIGFTVLTMSISLIAVFIPLLMMGGIVGRLFREFAVTLSHHHPLLAAGFPNRHPLHVRPSDEASRAEKHGVLFRLSERGFEKLLACYRHSLLWALDNSALMLTALLLMIALNAVLIVKIPKGFFPRQDTGALQGGMQGPQDASFPVMNASMKSVIEVIRKDPAVQNVEGYVGQGNGGFVYVALKPLDERKISADAGHQPAAPKTEQPSRSRGLSAVRAGPAHRRPVTQCPLSIHPPIGQC